MRRDPDQTVNLVFTSTALAFVLGSGCSGLEGGPAQFSIEVAFERHELLDQATRVAIYFYESTASCADLRAQYPHPASLLGPFLAELTDEGRRSGIQARIDPVPVDTYVVFADAIDASGRVVGSGCAPDQEIFEREITGIRVTIS